MATIGVKICGIVDPKSLHEAASAGADWVGFNFFPPSPRSITLAQAAALSASLEGGPARVGLFVEPSDAEIDSALAAVPLDILQIYADPARAAAIRQRFGLPVWRAVGVANASDLPNDSEAVDAYLLDAKPPRGATLPGGNANSFDWSVLRGWDAKRPWILAGGLSPDNVANAIAASGATAVDVSSGVERSRGIKDPALIRAFVDRAKAA